MSPRHSGGLLWPSKFAGGIELRHDNASAFPAPTSRHAAFDQSIERLNGEFKRRTEVVGGVSNEAAITRLAILLEQNMSGRFNAPDI